MPAQPDAVLLLTRALIYRSYGEYDRAIDRQLALEVTTEALRIDPISPTYPRGARLRAGRSR